MTDDQWTLIRALARCSYYPGSFDKRFIHDLAEKPRDATLSEKQDAQLQRIAWSKRRQLGPGIAVTPPPGQGSSSAVVPNPAEVRRLRAWNAGAPIRERLIDDLWPENEGEV